MGIFFVILSLVMSSWALVALIRRLRRKHASTPWWVAFSAFVLVGIATGVWCAFYCEYPLGTDFRVGSFPLPVVFFHLEQGQWVDFPVPHFQAWSAALTNVVSITALATLPLWLFSWREHRNRSLNNAL
jgi:hypothetical protein